MDKELTIQDLEAQADALLAAADEMEGLLPADTGKSKRKKAEDEAPEKKAPKPLDEKGPRRTARRRAAAKERKAPRPLCQGQAEGQARLR